MPRTHRYNLTTGALAVATGVDVTIFCGGATIIQNSTSISGKFFDLQASSSLTLNNCSIQTPGQSLFDCLVSSASSNCDNTPYYKFGVTTLMGHDSALTVENSTVLETDCWVSSPDSL